MTRDPRGMLVVAAFRLEWITVAWMFVEALVAVLSGIHARSMTLVAFGADSVIELASAGVLIWRLNVELRMQRQFPERIEARASKIAAGLLFALAAYLVVGVSWSLFRRHGEEFSISGLIVALIAIPAMALLARAKLQVAEKLSSRALRADAIEAITCGYLSFAVVLGLVAQLVFHVWWIDSATSIAILYLVMKEAREAWRGDDCCPPGPSSVL